MNDILAQNKKSWDTMADKWFGTTALPTLGCSIPKESELCLFGDTAGKRLLDIGCGSGHSMLYHAQKGAGELWGLDISSRQLENAEELLAGRGYSAKLFCSPMENDPGLPKGYFDIAYSIYAIGWATDLPLTFRLVSSYLKPGGVFIFSWDHPFMHCVSPEDGRYVLDGGYFDEGWYTFTLRGEQVSIRNRKLSDYIHALVHAGFVIERMVEETDSETLHGDAAFSSDYYAPAKAKLIPLSFVMKARKHEGESV